MTIKGRILVVEDDDKLARLLRRALSDAGVRTDTAGTGEEAIRLVTSTSYAALVVDVMLPGIDGLETCRRLRRGGLRCPVLVMSAREIDRSALVASGVDAFLQKPFPLSGLTARLNQLPERHPLDRKPTVPLPRIQAGLPTASPERSWHTWPSRALRRVLSRHGSPVDARM